MTRPPQHHRFLFLGTYLRMIRKRNRRVRNEATIRKRKRRVRKEATRGVRFRNASDERRRIPRMELTLEDGEDRQFIKGVYEGMAVVAKKLEEGEEIHKQSPHTNRHVVNYLKAVELENNVFLLYRDIEGTFESLMKKDDSFMSYGGKKQYFFTDISRTVMLSLVNTLYIAHENNRVHKKLARSIFFVRRKFRINSRDPTDIYHAVITNNFTHYDEEANPNVVQKAKNENWKEVGDILESIVPSGVFSKFDSEVSSLINILRGDSNAGFKGKMAVHAPCLWSEPYRLAFVKWALNIVKGKRVILKENELDHGDWKKKINNSVLEQKVRRSPRYKDSSQGELVKFIRNLSKHPHNFKPFKPTTPLYRNVHFYVKWRFPKFYVNFVSICIRDNIQEMERGLEFVGGPDSDSDSDQELERGQTPKRGKRR